MCVPGRAKPIWQPPLYRCSSVVPMPRCAIAPACHPPLSAARARTWPLLKPHPSLVAYKGPATPSAQIPPAGAPLALLFFRSTVSPTSYPLRSLSSKFGFASPCQTSHHGLPVQVPRRPDHRRAPAPPPSPPPATSGEPRTPPPWQNGTLELSSCSRHRHPAASRCRRGRAATRAARARPHPQGKFGLSYQAWPGARQAAQPLATGSRAKFGPTAGFFFSNFIPLI
jgi:hypothetical protein